MPVKPPKVGDLLRDYGSLLTSGSVYQMVLSPPNLSIYKDRAKRTNIHSVEGIRTHDPNIIPELEYFNQERRRKSLMEVTLEEYLALPKKERAETKLTVSEMISLPSTKEVRFTVNWDYTGGIIGTPGLRFSPSLRNHPGIETDRSLPSCVLSLPAGVTSDWAIICMVKLPDESFIVHEQVRTAPLTHLKPDIETIFKFSTILRINDVVNFPGLLFPGMMGLYHRLITDKSVSKINAGPLQLNAVAEGNLLTHATGSLTILQKLDAALDQEKKERYSLVSDFKEVLASVSKGEIDASTQEDFERSRHNYFFHMVARVIGTAGHGDADLKNLWNYHGPDSHLTPDIAFEKRVSGDREIWIGDVAVTSTEGGEILAGKTKKYEQVREGVGSLLSKTVQPTDFVCVYRESKVLTQPFLERFKLRLESSEIFKVFCKDCKTVDSILQADRKGRKRFRGGISLVFEDLRSWLGDLEPFIPFIRTCLSPEAAVRCEEKEVPTESEVPFKNRRGDTLESLALEYAQSVANSTVPAPPLFSELNDLRLKLIAEGMARPTLKKKDFQLPYYVPKGGNLHGSAVTSNMWIRSTENPTILKELVSVTQNVLLLSARDFFPLRSFKDGTQQIIISDHLKPDNTHMPIRREWSNGSKGLLEAYQAFFAEKQSYYDWVTELAENICYLEGRRRIIGKQVTDAMVSEAAAKEKYLDKKILLSKERSKGTSVYKCFKGYSLMIYRGSALRSNVSLRYKIIIDRSDNPNMEVAHMPESFHLFHDMSGTPYMATKWLTMTSTDLTHYLRCSPCMAIMKKDPNFSPIIGELGAIFIHNKRKTSTFLQDTRYLLLGFTSVSSDYQGLLKLATKGTSGSNFEDSLRRRALDWSLEMYANRKNLVSFSLQALFEQEQRYNDILFPSFFGVHKRRPDMSRGVSSKISLVEIYSGYLFIKEAGYEEARYRSMVEKLFECEVTFREGSLSEEWRRCALGGLRPGDKTGMFKYDARVVAAAAESLCSNHAGLAASCLATLDILTLQVNDLLKLTASGVEEPSTGFAKKERLSVNLAALIKKYNSLSVLVIASNLLSGGRENRRLFFLIFPKAQIGGDREITVQIISTRIILSIPERFFKRLCASEPGEMITSHNKKQLQTGHLQSAKDAGTRSTGMGLLPFNLSANLDATRWSPGFMVEHFTVMATNGSAVPWVKSLLTVCIREELVKRIQMPPVLVKKFLSEKTGVLHKDSRNKDGVQSVSEVPGSIVNPSFTEKYSKRSEKEREIIDECLSSPNYSIRFFSGMGQGVLHYTSSFYQACCEEFQQAVEGLMYKALEMRVRSSLTLYSSDDKLRSRLFLLREQGDFAKAIAVFVICSIQMSEPFNIFANKKKSNINTIFSEFNSYFSIFKDTSLALIKDYYTLFQVPDYSCIESAVENKVGELRRIFENGASLSICLFGAKLMREMFERHLRLGKVKEEMLKVHPDSEADLPAEFGFFPTTNILRVMMFGTQSTILDDGNVWSTFRSKIYGTKAAVRAGDEWGDSVGRIRLVLASKFTSKPQSYRREIQRKMGISEQYCRDSCSPFSFTLGKDDLGNLALMRFYNYTMNLKEDFKVTEAKFIHSLIKSNSSNRFIRIDGLVDDLGQSVLCDGLVSSFHIISSRPANPNIGLLFGDTEDLKQKFKVWDDALVTSSFSSVPYYMSVRRIKCRADGMGLGTDSQSLFSGLFSDRDPNSRVLLALATLSALTIALGVSKLEKPGDVLVKGSPLKLLCLAFGSSNLDAIRRFFIFYCDTLGHFDSEILLPGGACSDADQFVELCYKGRYFPNGRLTIRQDYDNIQKELIKTCVTGVVESVQKYPDPRNRWTRCHTFPSFYTAYAQRRLGFFRLNTVLYSSTDDGDRILTDLESMFIFRIRFVAKKKICVGHILTSQINGSCSQVLRMAILRETSRVERVEKLSNNKWVERGVWNSIAIYEGQPRITCTRELREDGVSCILKIESYSKGFSLAKIPSSDLINVTDMERFTGKPFRSIQKGDVPKLVEFVNAFEGGWSNPLLSWAAQEALSSDVRAELITELDDYEFENDSGFFGSREFVNALIMSGVKVDMDVDWLESGKFQTTLDLIKEGFEESVLRPATMFEIRDGGEVSKVISNIIHLRKKPEALISGDEYCCAAATFLWEEDKIQDPGAIYSILRHMGFSSSNCEIAKDSYCPNYKELVERVIENKRVRATIIKRSGSLRLAGTETLSYKRDLDLAKKEPELPIEPPSTSVVKAETSATLVPLGKRKVVRKTREERMQEPELKEKTKQAELREKAAQVGLEQKVHEHMAEARRILELDLRLRNVTGDTKRLQLEKVKDLDDPDTLKDIDLVEVQQVQEVPEVPQPPPVLVEVRLNTRIDRAKEVLKSLYQDPLTFAETAARNPVSVQGLTLFVPLLLLSVALRLAGFSYLG